MEGVRIKTIGDVAILYLDGRLDIVHTAEVETEVQRVLKDRGYKKLIFNLAKLEYMSSSGIRMLITVIRAMAEKEDGWIRMCDLNPQVDKIFEAAQVKSIFDIYPTEKDALAA